MFRRLSYWAVLVACSFVYTHISGCKSGSADSGNSNSAVGGKLSRVDNPPGGTESRQGMRVDTDLVDNKQSIRGDTTQAHDKQNIRGDTPQAPNALDQKSQLFVQLYTASPAIKILLYNLSAEDKRVVEDLLVSLKNDKAFYDRLAKEKVCGVAQQRDECLAEVDKNVKLLVSYLTDWVTNRVRWDNVQGPKDDPYPPGSMQSRWWMDGDIYNNRGGRFNTN